MELFNTITTNRFWSKHAVTLAWGIAALLMVLVIARISWISYSQNKIKSANYQAQPVAPLARPTKRSYRVNDIVAANLFGDPNPPPVVKQAPKTTLNLTLQGILSASDPLMARAIIQGADKKKSELYSVGEAIKGAGASVKEIRHNEVLINRNGATESLPLIKSAKSGNRQILTFSNVDSGSSGEAAIAATQSAATRSEKPRLSTQFSAANRNSTQRTRARNGKPRKVRKPNFSGLDRALKKMGEL